MTTHAELQSNPLIKSKCPVLAETAAQIGDVQVRNKGTIGGSAVHADPASDYPAALLALEAEFIIQDPQGIRVLKPEDFFVGMLMTAVSPHEILTHIRIPRLPENTRGAYLKFAQKASGFAICGVAALITKSGNKCVRARIGITGVAQMAYRAKAVEHALEAAELTPSLIAQAANKAADGVEALSDIHASADYRKDLACTYTRRAITSSLSTL